MNYYQFMDKADAWWENDGLFDYLVKAYNLFMSLFNSNKFIKILLILNLIFLLIILIRSFENRQRLLSRGFWRGWKAKEKDVVLYCEENTEGK